MQFQADILDVSVKRAAINETTALGAAYLAGLAVGYWSSKDALLSNVKVAKTYNSRMNKEIRDELYQGWKKAVKATQAF